MDWDVWGPAILSSITASVATAGIGGIIIKTVIEGGIKHALERQIERLKSDLRNSENELTSIRGAVLGGMTSRGQELSKRRLQAAEKLWSATMFQRRFSLVVTITTFIRIDAVDAALDRGDADADGIKKFAENMWKAQNVEQLMQEKLSNVTDERLFVPKRAWDAYMVLWGMTGQATATLAAIQAGIKARSVVSDLSLVNSNIVEILPHTKDFLAQNPSNGAFFLIGQLEELIFQELNSSLSGKDFDLDAVKHASDLVKATVADNTQVARAVIPEQFRIDIPDIVP